MFVSLYGRLCKFDGHCKVVTPKSTLELCMLDFANFKGYGRWRYKLTVSLKFAKSPPYKDTRIHGWALALQTYCVPEIYNVYHTKIQTFKGKCWHYKLTVSVIFAQSTMQRYNN